MENRENQNCIILNQQNKLLEVGKDLIPYMKKNSNYIIYDEGSLQNNDIILYGSTTASQNITLCRFLCRKFNIKETITYKNPIVFIGIFGENGDQIIMVNETEVDIDTILCGHQIQVKAREGYIEIILGQETLNNNDCNGKLMILNKGHIKFLSDENLTGILEGERFPAFISFGNKGDVHLNEIFKNEIYDAIMEIYDGGNKKIKFCGEAISITVKLFKGVYEQIRIIRIENEIHIAHTISSYMQKLDQLRKLQAHDAVLESFSSKYQALGISGKILEDKALLKKVTTSNISIMLTGESGTGKTFLAREIHKSSRKNEGPFVHVNCAAISPALIESELFGYAEGAFTGAKKGGKQGYFEMAQNGTIFLDEIAELPMELQGRLLEVIQEKTFYRVGGNNKIHVNCRFITATNQDLKQMIYEKTFREDLYYRINVFSIDLLPLRERIEDIQLLSSVLLPKICQRLEIEPLMLSSQAIASMKKYNWPGNIRELENILEKSSVLCDSKIIFPEHLDIPVCLDSTETIEEFHSLKDALELAEQRIILKALIENNFEKGRTAKALKIGRTNLFEKIRKYKLEEDK